MHGTMHDVEQLFNSMSVEKEHVLDNIKNERRVSIDSSSLTYLSSFSGSTVHTIICWRYHLVKLDLVEGVKLLRVLDAEPADWDWIPDQLFELFHLRYLAIRYCHDIRALEKLQNLQTLIIRREKQSKFFIGVNCGLVLPWCLQKLRHVYFYHTIYFDDPEGITCSLENLQTLSKVDNWSCTEEILKKIPNIKKMMVDCSGRGDQMKNLVHLHRLENLKLGGRNPDFMFTLPETLKKLSLDGLGIPWRNLTIVGSLPNLQVLKLTSRACDGSTWETTEGEFQRLEFLLINVSDLKEWMTESSHFPRLKHLQLHHCRFLEIPGAIGEIPTLEVIEVFGDEEEPATKSARRIKEEQEDLGNEDLQVRFIARRRF